MPPFIKKRCLSEHCLTPSSPPLFPTVTLDFHINQVTQLPVLYHKHLQIREEAARLTLDGRRVLTFYLERMQPFSFRPGCLSLLQIVRGTPVSTQRLSKWVFGCIFSGYEATNIQLPPWIIAYFTRLRSTSIALLKNVPIAEMCKTPTWVLGYTFSKYYVLVHASRADDLWYYGSLVALLDLAPNTHFCWRVLRGSHLK